MKNKKIDKRKFKHNCDYAEKDFEELQSYIRRKSVKDIKYYELREKWKNVFSRYLEYWSWNQDAINDLFGFGENGHNWELLWFPAKNAKEKEKNQRDSSWRNNEYLKQYEFKSLKKELDSFIGEVDYCFDRMSMDRLLRCHWEYNVIINHYFEKDLNKFLYPNLYR